MIIPLTVEDINILGGNYLDYSKLDSSDKVDTVIDNIIYRISINTINRILHQNYYLNHLLHEINSYLNTLLLENVIFYRSNIKNSLVSDDYSFKITISFTYDIGYGRTNEFTREICSNIDDMVDKCQSNINIKLNTLFNKYN